MNYKLCIYIKGTNSYKEIDLSSLIEDQFSLKSIDNFTLQFDSEESFKKYLLDHKLIDETDMDQKIFIGYGRKDKRSVKVIYSDIIDIMNNISKLAQEIKLYFNIKKQTTHSDFSYGTIMEGYERITDYFNVFEVMANKKNRKFLKLLTEYTSGNTAQFTNCKDILNYIKEDKDFTRDKFLFVALYEYFRTMFYRYNEKTKDLDFSYKGFRDFCVFYQGYKNSLKKKKENVIDDDSKYIEPDFVPNSEEERIYNDYMERQDEVWDQNIDTYDEFYGENKKKSY